MEEKKYKENSITLKGAVGLGTGVMIGAGIFALLGQVAELTGALFPLSFLVGAIITGFSAYTYSKMANAFPSAGGIGMFFVKIYGKGVITASASLLMAFSMVINQSLVARTFGTYTLQLFNVDSGSYLVQVLGIILLALAFIVNLSGNRFIETFTSVMSLIKVVGIALFALAALWVSGISFESKPATAMDNNFTGFIASLGLTILAFKGFTTITNNGSEIVKPHRNISRAIAISISICALLYLLVAWAVASSLPLPEILKARDYALAEAARPMLGSYGLWFTVSIAIIATITGIIASVFAVSRMTAMLTEMKLIPHKHFGMSGTVQQHMLVYTVVIAMVLTIFFDLSRIASLGAIFYIFMDIILQWGVLRRLHKKIDAKPHIILAALAFDVIVLIAFLWYKATTDWLIIVLSIIFILAIFIGEKLFLKTVFFDDGGGNNN
jgi:amino acid transporter